MGSSPNLSLGRQSSVLPHPHADRPHSVSPQDPLLDRLGRQPAPHRGCLHERCGPAHHPQGDGLGGLAQRAHRGLPGEAHPLDRCQVRPGHSCPATTALPWLPKASLPLSPPCPCPLHVPPDSGSFPMASVLFCHLASGLGAKAFALWGLLMAVTFSSLCSVFPALQGLQSLV